MASSPKVPAQGVGRKVKSSTTFEIYFFMKPTRVDSRSVISAIATTFTCILQLQHHRFISATAAALVNATAAANISATAVALTTATASLLTTTTASTLIPFNCSSIDNCSNIDNYTCNCSFIDSCKATAA